MTRTCVRNENEMKCCCLAFRPLTTWSSCRVLERGTFRLNTGLGLVFTSCVGLQLDPHSRVTVSSRLQLFLLTFRWRSRHVSAGAVFVFHEEDLSSKHKP